MVTASAFRVPGVSSGPKHLEGGVSQEGNQMPSYGLRLVVHTPSFGET